MTNDKFWEVVKRFNSLMKSAIDGPNCLDVCHGDCCSIRINVPKILANEYVEKGYAIEDDFIRSDVFSFKLRFDEEKAKCFLYDKNINGCLVHASGIKPPQCWIYPTKFTNPEMKEISCKRAGGWKIIDFEKAKKAEEILQYYVFLCQLEGRKELKNINERLINSTSRKNLKLSLKDTAPSRIAGFRDQWNSISILPAEGISLQMKKFCTKNCKINFLECTSVCAKVTDMLLNFLQQNLYQYVKKRGPNAEGEYSFLNLQELQDN